jgi:dihydroorotate dehydrogenase (fumarate)
MDLSTSYLGLRLSSPLVVSPSPQTQSIDGVRKMADAGAGAVVLYSLFEEQLTLSMEELSSYLSAGSSYAEALEEISESERLRTSPLDYLRYVSAARYAVDVPIIASINGAPHLRWTHYAKLLEQAGASAIEVNLYFVSTDFEQSSADVEESYLATLRAIVEEVDVPVAAKLSPYFTNLANMAKRIADTGVKALVLFNRFYQPDIDVNQRVVVPRLELSSQHDLRLPLRWTAILHDRVDVDIAVTGGVHTAEDALKAILAGANVAMVCSVLLQEGIGHLDTLRRGLLTFMAAEEINSLDEIRGAMSHGRHEDAASFERAQYIRTLESVR